MVKTFCDCCDAYIPVVNSMNIWTLPSKQKVVIARGGKGFPKLYGKRRKLPQELTIFATSALRI